MMTMGDLQRCLGEHLRISDIPTFPLTLISIITPIKVSHGLIAEIYFSIYGETDQSQKKTRPGPGGLRVLKISRPIIVPSVSENALSRYLR